MDDKNDVDNLGVWSYGDEVTDKVVSGATIEVRVASDEMVNAKEMVMSSSTLSSLEEILVMGDSSVDVTEVDTGDTESTSRRMCSFLGG